MAYVRVSVQDQSNGKPRVLFGDNLEGSNSSSLSSSSTPPIIQSSNIKSKDESNNHKELKIFTIDLSKLSPLGKYIALACGMFFFMCLYGYFQELVVYGWFDRKLSIFSTFLHFLGCSFFAQLQYNYSSSGVAAKAAAANRNHTMSSIRYGGNIFTQMIANIRSVVFVMGTAPPRLAFGTFLSFEMLYIMLLINMFMELLMMLFNVVYKLVYDAVVSCHDNKYRPILNLINDLS